MNTELLELLVRLDAAFRTIAIVSGQYKIELMRLNANAHRLHSQIGQEMINCRRTQRASIKYKELVASLETVIETMEQYLIMATLLS
jgi:uncharacterized membrane protein YqiK